jgi:hypothetical protein
MTFPFAVEFSAKVLARASSPPRGKNAITLDDDAKPNSPKLVAGHPVQLGKLAIGIRVELRLAALNQVV